MLTLKQIIIHWRNTNNYKEDIGVVETWYLIILLFVSFVMIILAGDVRTDHLVDTETLDRYQSATLDCQV